MSWSELCAALGAAELPHLAPEALAAVLAAADATTTPAEPMLSTLLAVGDPHRCRKPFHAAATMLGRPQESQNAQRDVRRLYEIWRHG
jgi:hypothetical protein